MNHYGVRAITRLVLVAGCILLPTLAACGGGDDKKQDNAARNPTDPRRVPTATVPAQPATPIAALESGQTAGRSSLPDSYVVKAGDTLGSIAGELGITAEELTRANANIDPRGLRIGQELRVPRATPTPNPSAARATPTPQASAGRSPTPSPSPGGSATPAPSGSPSASRTPSPSPSASGSPAASASPSGAGGTYMVQSGDTGCAIARRFMVSVQQLASANNLSIDALASLRVGQSLQIPRSTGADPGC